MFAPHGREHPPRTPRARGLSPRAFPAERRTKSWGLTPQGLTPALVPDPHFAVERVALYGGLAEGFDQVDELLGRRPVCRAGGGDDVLLDHHRAHVVGAEAERDLADLHPLRDPGR